MADLNLFWHAFIIFFTVLGIVGLFALIYVLSRKKVSTSKNVETMGHVWDGDLEELNNPLPRWWLNLFYISLVFSVGYLLFYPGLGTFAGWFKWTQVTQYQDEIKAAEAKFGPLYEKYRTQDLAAVAADPHARKIGERLFATYCTGCHGSDARGARGFPNLRDGDWLYGNAPETIHASIMNGRTGVMPAWGAVLGADGTANTTEYVLSLSGRPHNATAAVAGKEKFAQLCAGCHGADGRGNQAIGAPNLTDNVWLYGGTTEIIAKSIGAGRSGRMPAHAEFLGEAKVHLLAAYVFSLAPAEQAGKVQVSRVNP